MEDVISTAKRKRLKIGCIVVVQTHGRFGRYNPHLHIIMTSGGVKTDLEACYGLEATRTFKTWASVIREGIKRIGRIVKGAYQIVRLKKYKEDIKK
ncbi:MAG: transposase [Deltaproteobacteria bacterium]|nr:transposase [Deltaproteobacteria bacterium]